MDHAPPTPSLSTLVNEAVRSCLERGGLVHWRGLMRAVWADPHGPIAARLEHFLDDVEDDVHQTEADPLSFEGGVDSVSYSLWRAYLRDARAWRADRDAEQGEA